jgi:adenine phosphoribosyltransferase
MATLEALKQALRHQVPTTDLVARQPLSDAQYSVGFKILRQAPSSTTYEEFIMPRITQLSSSLLESKAAISVLEIGPSPKSILSDLPEDVRRKIDDYTAYEPNQLFASQLETLLCSPLADGNSLLPCLGTSPDIRKVSYTLWNDTQSNVRSTKTYDLVLFRHSMYGMKPKRAFVEQALETLRSLGGEMVVIFHRDASVDFEGLVCHRTASYPNELIFVEDEDTVLDCFAPFIAGFSIPSLDAMEGIRDKWRDVCRALGGRKKEQPGHIFFSAPEIMVAFTQHATALPELTAKVPFTKQIAAIKNREARGYRPAAIMKPTQVQQVQDCVRWALQHGVGLTVVGGSHSGQCLWPSVLAIDMSAFDRVHILEGAQDEEDKSIECGILVVVGAGCRTGEIVRKTMVKGVTVPSGARPSVGAGLWLQGGIGHLARSHGLASDSIVGAVMVSVKNGQIVCVGHVPREHSPANAIHPDNEADVLWALKGAGTNFGIVLSVVFRAHPAPTFSVQNWVVPLADSNEAQLKLREFDDLVASKLDKTSSADAYLYWESNKLCLGVTVFESAKDRLKLVGPRSLPLNTSPEHTDDFKILDTVQIFDSEMYISRMHGGHGGGKTSSFKRCLFLKNIGEVNVTSCLITALKNRPSPLCYIHLIHGGKAVSTIAAKATAFGCRDWDFACVITGVWTRDSDGTEEARSAMNWVYDVAHLLLPLSVGVYSADLGPDPRDAALAAHAFGPNRPRLSRIKATMDPQNVLAYACPLGNKSVEPKLIVLVTGRSCAGKDYCADIWASVFNSTGCKGFTARKVSISDATKREYAEIKGVDLHRLMEDRQSKELHRPALTAFFEEKVSRRPQLPAEHFLEVIYDATDTDVLFITGMRDTAPVASFSHLVPDSKLIELRVRADGQAWQDMQKSWDQEGGATQKKHNSGMPRSSYGWCPCLVFENEIAGKEGARDFAESHLFPLLHNDMKRLRSMVRTIPGFPRAGIDFRHVLGITQHQGGLALCSSLLQSQYTGDWSKVDAVIGCEAGGFVFASALATHVDVPLVLIRKCGKLPPPTVSVNKPTSHISYGSESSEKRIEIEQGVLKRGATVVVVDDVIASGATLCAVFDLLTLAGVKAESVSVMVVAEFPIHRGRELVRQRGFGNARIHSLLVYGSA